MRGETCLAALALDSSLSSFASHFHAIIVSPTPASCICIVAISVSHMEKNEVMPKDAIRLSNEVQKVIYVRNFIPITGERMTFGTSKVTSKGQVTIPAEIRKNLGLEDGTNVVFLEVEDGVLIKSEKNIRDALEPFDRRRKELKLTKKGLEEEVREERKKRGKRNA